MEEVTPSGGSALTNCLCSIEDRAFASLLLGMTSNSAATSNGGCF